MLQVEFFHDVICSFCFPMSNRMRKITNQYPNLNVIHRSFALGWEKEDFERMFGTHAAVKPEVLNHWVAANQNDDDHRFNIAGMEAEDFLFPTSKPGLLAAKAAGEVGGQKAYWDLFDKLQEALFVKSLDIADTQVIEQLVKETSLDFNQWQASYQSSETEAKVLSDLQLVQSYGVQGAPALVINQKYVISGAQPQAVIEETIQEIAEKEGVSLTGLQVFGDANGAACQIVEGRWVCD